MNRCMICKSGFMNIHSFKVHKDKFHPDQEQGSNSVNVPARPLNNTNISRKPNVTAMKDTSRHHAGKEASVQNPVKVQSVGSTDGITKKVSSEKVDAGDKNDQVNTTTSDLNDCGNSG